MLNDDLVIGNGTHYYATRISGEIVKVVALAIELRDPNLVHVRFAEGPERGRDTVIERHRLRINKEEDASHAQAVI